MKNRPVTTTSERELIVALAEGGRSVTLTSLAGWRKEGLLPPLASRGLGMGKGKSYYWRESNIVTHACAAYDLLHKYGRPEVAVWMLWLSGFSVPLPQLRRVWAYRSKGRKIWTARPGVKQDQLRTRPAQTDRSAIHASGAAAQVLLEAVLTLGGALVPDDGDSAAITRVIERALAWISRTNRFPALDEDQMAQRLWLVIRIVSTALEGSDLISIASDSDLRDAQKFLALAGTLLQKCDDLSVDEIEETVWPSWLAERLAAPLFLLILVLVRSGRKPLLEQLATRVEKMSRQTHRPPAQPSYSIA